MKKILKRITSLFLTLVMVMLLCPKLTQAKDFTIKDVAKTDESYEQIQWVLNQGYMGLTLGNFFPNSYVRRDEFCVVLAKINGDINSLLKPAKSSFKDVTVKDQFFRYIETEKKYMSYFKSSTGTYFKPKIYLAREDAMKSIVMVMGYNKDSASGEGVDSEISLDNLIEDNEKVSSALESYVTLAVVNELIDLRVIDDKNYVDPKKSITRKQLAMFLYNAAQKKDLTKEDDSIDTEDPEQITSKVPTLKNITLNIAKSNINVGEMTKATVLITMEPNDAKQPNYKFSSNNPSIAMIDGDGNIIGIKSGTVDIIVEALDKKAKTTLNVDITTPNNTISSDIITKPNSEVIETYKDVSNPFHLNVGRVAKSQGYVFFSELNESTNIGSTLNRIKEDNTEPKKLGEFKNIRGFFIKDNRIYLSNSHHWSCPYLDKEQTGILCIDFDGNVVNKISTDNAESIMYYKDYIYYINKSDCDKLYRIKLDGTMKESLSANECANYDIQGNTIYYAHNESYAKKALYKIDLDNYNLTKIEGIPEDYNISIKNILEGSLLFKQDMSSLKLIRPNNKVQDVDVDVNRFVDSLYYYKNNFYILRDYKIYRTKTDYSKETLLTDGDKLVWSIRLIEDDYIYFNDVCRMKIDGSGYEVLKTENNE